MKRIEFPDPADWPAILERPTARMEDIEESAKEVFRQVRAEGDEAVKHFTALFDGVQLDELRISRELINSAESSVDDQLKEAIKTARKNIETFHRSQQEQVKKVATMPGVSCWQEKRPIERVGFYIPGGSAPLFSTVLMLAVPAAIAGCREMQLFSPPNKEGKIHPAILYAAHLCGVEKIYAVGGIQAIATMTFGTATIKKVDKIYGPGNQYVTVAKQLATRYGVAIDMPAGPSELLVYADDSARADFVASDLLSQAEHGPDSQVIMVSTSRNLLDQVQETLTEQLDTLPRREIARKAIENSRMILVGEEQEALRLINQYGTEHLIICSENEDYFARGIQHAGSVFLGNFSPESAGDYASGTNHTLPTGGYTRQYSGLNLDSFTKAISFQKISAQGILNLGPTVETMAAAEGLEAHRRALTLRLDYLKQQ
jgi:histidinol dehydrogenase